MYQKDYILRMLEMMGDFIAAIFARIKKKDFEKAAELLQNSYQTLLRTDAALFYHIPSNNLTETLVKEHNYTNGHIEILSELLLAEAELRFAEQKWEQSFHCFEKAKVLMMFLDQNSKSISIQRQSNISLIENRMEALSKKSFNL